MTSKLVGLIVLATTAWPAAAWFEIDEVRTAEPEPPTAPIPTQKALPLPGLPGAGSKTPPVLPVQERGAGTNPAPGPILDPSTMLGMTSGRPAPATGGMAPALPGAGVIRGHEGNPAPPAAPVPPPEPDLSWHAQPGPIRVVFDQVAARHGYRVEWHQSKAADIWETTSALKLKGKDIVGDVNDLNAAINYRTRLVDVTVHTAGKIVEVSVID